MLDYSELITLKLANYEIVNPKGQISDTKFDINIKAGEDHIFIFKRNKTQDSASIAFDHEKRTSDSELVEKAKRVESFIYFDENKLVSF